jgi:hypothetical protein
MKNVEPHDSVSESLLRNQDGNRPALTRRTQAQDLETKLYAAPVEANPQNLPLGPRQQLEQAASDAAFAVDEEHATPTAAREPFVIQGDFWDQARKLRNQFDQKMIHSQSADPNENPLTYVCCENEYQFLGATAERVFDGELIFEFLDTLRAWAQNNLKTYHASTPRIHIYVGGSHRHLAKDAVEIRWHYVFCLTPDQSRVRPIKLSLESASDGVLQNGLGVSTVANIRLKFNELLVHDAARPYGIREIRGSMQPRHGMLLLDGYLW